MHTGELLHSTVPVKSAGVKTTVPLSKATDPNLALPFSTKSTEHESGEDNSKLSAVCTGVKFSVGISSYC